MTAGTANLVTDNYGTVGGGGNNRAGDNAGSTADRIYATVAGGKSNTASASYATIAGGGESTPGTPATGNRATDNYCTVGGGGNNQAGDGDTDPTTAPYATVGGGNSNTASNDYGTVAGGEGNTASGSYSAIGGGDTNTASGSRATVGGGLGNIASGSYATVPGGYQNAAAALYSFAAGYRAKANHSGAFVWGDLTANDVASTGNNQFIVRASGGIWFGTTSSPSIPAGDFLNTSTGGHLTTGGQWTNASDREMKENFTRVDGQAVLASLAEIPITTWNSKAEDASIRHMGPVAQDFYAAFGLGTSDTSIGTLDADGVALAAIQGLYQLSQEQAERIQALERENVEFRQRLGDLETRVTALEGGAPVSGDSAGLLSGLSAGWLALGGLAVVAGLVLVQRRRPGGRP